MNFGSSKTILGVLGTAVLTLAAIGSAAGQATPAKKPAATGQAAAAKKPAAAVLPVGTPQNPLMVGQAFKNVQVLKGIPATEFMDTMGFISASLVETCTYCHIEESSDSWARYADDTPMKTTTRNMIRMVNDINRTNFGGQRLVTCYSCHNGTEVPRDIPDLASQYAPPDVTEPDEIVGQARNAPPPEQILDKYIQAVGGAQRVATITSFVAKGAYEGYSASESGTAEIDAKAPNQRTVIFQTMSGETTSAYNGRSGWLAGPEEVTPFPVVALSGDDLDGMKVDAMIAFPGAVKQTFTKWRTGNPVTINGQQAQVIQGTSPGGHPVKLYFDSKTGLLVREVRFIRTIIGRNPYRVDFSDYRDVSDVKMPFHMVVTWVDGRSTMNFDDVQLNVPIEAAKFAQPARVISKASN